MSRRKKRGSPHSCGLPRVAGYRIMTPTGCASLLPKNRCEQSFAFGLLFSVRALGNCRHLARLFAVSTTHDLVQVLASE